MCIRSSGAQHRIARYRSPTVHYCRYGAGRAYYDVFYACFGHCTGVHPYRHLLQRLDPTYLNMLFPPQMINSFPSFFVEKQPYMCIHSTPLQIGVQEKCSRAARSLYERRSRRRLFELFPDVFLDMFPHRATTMLLLYLCLENSRIQL
jgi:hypothetical protein